MNDRKDRRQAEQRMRSSQLRFRVLFDKSSAGMFLFDVRLEVTECNDALLAMFTVPRDALIGRRVPFMGDDRVAPIFAAAAAGRDGQYEGLCETASGCRMLALKALSMKDEQGGVVGGCCIVEDRTAARQVEASLKRRTQILEAVHAVTADIGSDLQLRPVLRRIMDRAVQLLDARRGGGIYLYDPAEMVLRLTEVSGINEGRIGTILQLDEGMSGQVFRTGQPLIVNDYANWPGRATVLVPTPSSAVMGVPLFVAGKVIGVLGVFDDSERRTFDRDDVEVAEIFAAHAAMAIHNAELYEQAQREIAERERAQEALRQANDLLEVQVQERTRALAASNRRLAGENEERIAAENALRASEALSASVLASLSAHLAIIDPSGTIIRVNEAWDRFARENGVRYSAGAFVGTNYLDVIRRAAGQGDETVDAILAGIEGVLAGRRREFVIEYLCQTPSCDRWFNLRVLPMRRFEGGAVISHADVTDRKTAELEIARLRWDLSHAARVNSMGELTASLAHELNQPLTAILANVHAGSQMLAIEPLPTADLREVLAEVDSDARRAGEIIRRIRGLLKKEEFAFVPLDLSEVLREVLELIRSDAILRKASIVSQVDSSIPQVKGDRVQLQQVMLNLIMNGLEAMEETPAEERKLTIRINTEERQVIVGMQDMGPGIAEGNLGQIFSPFFTSKRNGFGMGLAICHSIVKAHGGRIWPENNEPRGATLWFSLPVAS